VILYSASRSSTHQVLLQNHQCSMDRTETCHSTPCYPMHNSHNFNVSDNQDTQARTMSKLFQKSYLFFDIGVHPLIITLVAKAEVDMLYASLQHQLCSSKCKSPIDV
jgi:hypothetical protein